MSTPPLIKILLVDDHTIIRKGLKQLLEMDNSIVICGEAENGEEAIIKALSLKPDIILMDINLPKVNGYEATRAILTAWPDARIIILTYQDDTKLIRKFLSVGVKGYFLKDVEVEILVEGVSRIFSGETLELSQDLLTRLEAYEHLASENVFNTFTEREKEVLLGLIKGYSNLQLAELLTVSPKTIHNHLYSIYAKIGVNTRSEAIVWANEQGIAQP